MFNLIVSNCSLCMLLVLVDILLSLIILSSKYVVFKA